MSKLPIVSGQKVVKALNKIGYEAVRQRGSHLRLKDSLDSNHNPVSVPLHKSVKPGLLRRIIKDANLTVDEFIELL